MGTPFFSRGNNAEIKRCIAQNLFHCQRGLIMPAMFYAAYYNSRAFLTSPRRLCFFVVRTIFQRTDNMRQDDAGNAGRMIAEF